MSSHFLLLCLDTILFKSSYQTLTLTNFLFLRLVLNNMGCLLAAALFFLCYTKTLLDDVSISKDSKHSVY
jgi:hypothetical protein